MTFTHIDKATAVIIGGTIAKSGFGDPVCDNFDDHETRILANESDIRGASNSLTVIRDTYHTRWHNAVTALVTNSTTATVVPFDTQDKAGSGITYSAGIFTVATAGDYDICANLSATMGTGTGFYVDMYIALNAAGAPSGQRYGKGRLGLGSASQILNQGLVASRVTFAAGATFSVWVALGSATNSTWVPTNPSTKETNIAIQRIG